MPGGSVQTGTEPIRRAADLPLYYNAVDVLERNLAVRPDKVALLSEARELSFRQVSAEVDQVTAALTGKLGIRLGDFVALLCLDSAEWVASFFGALKAGAIAVGLNTMLSPDEYSYILRDCRARALVVHESLLPVVEGIRDHLPFLEHVVVVGTPGRSSDLSYSEWIAGGPVEVEAAPTHREDLCMLNYTSGTTGEPKGIPHAHKDLPLSSQLYAVDAIGLREDDRNASVAKLFFTYGTGSNLIYPWYAGASVVLSSAPPRVATNLLETIDRFRPTIFHGVPTSYASMMAVERFAERYDLSSLRLCISAGEALPVPVWDAWKERTGLEIVEGIGTTENLALFLTNRIGDLRPGSSGKPVDGFEIAVVDDDGNPVPVGETGNLMVRSETAALSYLHQYEKSRAVFRGEWTSTGDRYRVDEDGFYWYVGRADEMLKVGGIWVSPLEVERTLMAHAAVLDVAVVGRPDRSSLVKPKAFVVLREGYAPSQDLEQELVEHCAAAMAPYKRPRWIEFLDELPRTATGKLQRSRLPS